MLRFVFYLTGIFYNINIFPEPIYSLVLKGNPLAFMISSFRDSILYQTVPSRKWLLFWFVISVALAAFGVRNIYNMDEYAITVKDLKIRYKSVQAYSIKKSLLRLKGVEAKAFEAVRGISFEVKQGEILGITGKNGSGKSTLLRALAHIFSADEGSIDLHGHSVSLLAIGVGFKNEMTGRENIMLSGMLLGFSEKEVQERMEDIIEFAGLGEFIDMPVRTYSSGMYSKLAFSITAILETDIMLIDEVLSVGDEKFKKKSYEKMKSLISQRNRTVVIVSHSLKTLEELCDRVMWMHEGKIVKIGEPVEVLNEYREFMK